MTAELRHFNVSDFVINPQLHVLSAGMYFTDFILLLFNIDLTNLDTAGPKTGFYKRNTLSVVTLLVQIPHIAQERPYFTFLRTSLRENKLRPSAA